MHAERAALLLQYCFLVISYAFDYLLLCNLNTEHKLELSQNILIYYQYQIIV